MMDALALEPTDLFFFGGTQGLPRACAPVEVRVHFTATDASETPLPVDVSPSALLDAPTGCLSVTPTAGDVVRSAAEYVRSLAFLPVREEQQRIGDELMAKRLAATTCTRITRRR